MARGKGHDQKLKAAVMAALLAGGSVSEVAREHALAKSVVSRWKDKLCEVQLLEADAKRSEVVRARAEQSIYDFGALIAHYLEQALITAAAQQVHFRDEDWLMRQNAADLAILHGVSVDKALRLLEASQRAGARL